MKSSSSVFDRSGGDTITGSSTFYLVLALSLIWGLLATGLSAEYAVNINFVPSGYLTFLGIGLVIPMIGVFISQSTDNAIVSFLGYHLIIIPFGFLLGPVVHKFSPDVVRNACYLTAIVTGIMGILGIAIPQFFSKIGGALFAALIGLLIVRILQIFIPAMASWGFIEYISAGIFSLYIGYDMYRASAIEKTVSNAIQVSVALYLDIINLFLSFLGMSDD